MKIQSRKIAWRIALGGLGIALVGVVLFVPLVPSSEGPVRSDKAMLETFKERRTDFERLVKMMSLDRGLVVVDFDWTDPGNPASIGVSLARLADYRAIFKRVGVRRGARVRGDGEVEFIDRTVGTLVNGWSKSFVYSETVPAALVAELESIEHDASSNGASYRATGVQFWYLKLNHS